MIQKLGFSSHSDSKTEVPFIHKGLNGYCLDPSLKNYR